MKKFLSILLAAMMLLSLCSAALAEEPVTLKVLVQLHELTKDPAEIGVFKQIQEMTNTKFEWTVVRSGWNEKKATMLASGDLPDIILSKGIEDADIAQNPEYFVALNEYLDAGKMPNLSAVFAQEPGLKAASTQLDGNIYSVPSQSFFGGESYGGFMINKTWLDKLGLEVPKTLADFKAALIAFRDGDPNGNGVADEIPFDMYAPGLGSGYHYLNLLGCWGLTATNDQIGITDEGKIVMAYTTDAFKKCVTYFADLWAENLINKESFTQDYTMFQANAQNPEVPLVGATPGWTIANRVGTQWADQYVCAGPFEVGDGTPAYFPTLNTLQTNKAVITTNCQNIDAAVAVLDACYNEQISVQMLLGSFGETMEYVDGKYVMTAPTDGSDADRWKWINAIADNGAYFISRETHENIELLSDYYARLNESNYFAPYLRDSAVALFPSAAKMSTEDSSELALLNADILNYVNNRVATWTTEGGIDAEWDEYVKQLDAMQVERVREIYQNSYDAYMAASK